MDPVTPEKDPLFQLLDMWASFGLSKHGPGIFIPVMVLQMQKFLDGVPSAQRSGADYAVVRDYLREYAASGKDVQLGKDHPFNRAMVDYLSAHREALPEIGKQILHNARVFLNPPG